MEAFQEALDLTAGQPYSSRGPVRTPAAARAAAEGPMPAELSDEAPAEDVATVNSDDYATIVKAYTIRKGEISYELLNKALIQAARSNPFVATMIANRASLEEIRDHVVKANFEAVTRNHSLSGAEVQRIVELLHEVSPRSVLRELNEDLRKMLAEACS